MTHLTDDQLEELLLAGQSDSEHLAACPQCRARWEEQCALRRRLHAAWSGIHAPGELAERLRRQIADASGAPHRASAFHWPPRFRWLAVAAVLLIGSALVVHYGTGSFENVAQAQLVEFHQANLSPSAGIYGSADPAKLATYMRSKLGYVPQVPQPVAGISIRGGCVAQVLLQAGGQLSAPNSKRAGIDHRHQRSPPDAGPSKANGMRHVQKLPVLGQIPERSQHGGRPTGRLLLLCGGGPPTGKARRGPDGDLPP